MLKNKNTNLFSDNLYETNFTAIVKVNSNLTRLIVPSHREAVITFDDDLLYKTGYIFIPDFKGTNALSILYRSAETSLPKLYEEFDSNLNLYSYNFNFLLDRRENIINNKSSPSSPDTDPTKKYFEIYERDEINDTPGVFIFLVDQSGSMRDSNIRIAKKSLKLFIKSLPENSYFHIVGFGSSYKSYLEPCLYEESSIKNAYDIADKLQADLGGTEIYNPLNFIFKSMLSKYPEHLSKSVFLITDGGVDNKETCINLIKENSRNFRVHAIGIGTSVDKDFVTRSGQAGKGNYYFAPDVEFLQKLVIQALNSSLRPYYSNINVEISGEGEGENKLEKIIEYPKQNSKTVESRITFQDEIFSYSFLS
jgi:hypothetical protein